MVEAGRFTHYAFDHARDIILVIAHDTGRIVDANKAAELAYQHSREELCAMRIFDLRVDPVSSVSAQMKVAGTAGILFETVHRRRDGSTFPVEVNSHMATEGLLFSVIRDISERKRNELERAELLETTQHALAVREEFLAIASHELRTPITSIDLKLQVLLRALDDDRPREQWVREATSALREVRRLGELVGALLDARAGNETVTIDPTELDLASVIAEVVDRFRMRAAQVKSLLELDVTEIRGRWDRFRIDQILSNLLSNALKYGAGQPITIHARAEGDTVHIEVRDRGIGVSADDAERIFQRFQRAVPAHYGGFGLGLYIARKAVDAHGGTIRVASSLGHGANFIVTLPLRYTK
jgi:PAS domain S-box-containing protein